MCSCFHSELFLPAVHRQRLESWWDWNERLILCCPLISSVGICPFLSALAQLLPLPSPYSVGSWEMPGREMEVQITIIPPHTDFIYIYRICSDSSIKRRRKCSFVNHEWGCFRITDYAAYRVHHLFVCSVIICHTLVHGSLATVFPWLFMCRFTTDVLTFVNYLPSSK